jgi:hypothetical protein
MLEVDVHDNVPPFLIADPDVLRTDVIGNLLGNALKFTPPGGMVRVSIRPDGERVGLEVADTGCGIPQDQLDHISRSTTRAGAPMAAPDSASPLPRPVSRRTAARFRHQPRRARHAVPHLTPRARRQQPPASRPRRHRLTDDIAAAPFPTPPRPVGSTPVRVGFGAPSQPVYKLHRRITMAEAMPHAQHTIRAERARHPVVLQPG